MSRNQTSNTKNGGFDNDKQGRKRRVGRGVERTDNAMMMRKRVFLDNMTVNIQLTYS